MSNIYRNEKIDFLRGMAILAVLILHFNLSYHLKDSALNLIFSKQFISTVTSNGNYGVTIFFVISGFLITLTSLNRYNTLGKVNLAGFYILRFARIMPCLVLALTIITLFNLLHTPIFENDANSTSFSLAIFSVMTFWHNVLMEKAGYFNYCLNILWSLSVEEIFYLAFPLICISLKRIRLILLPWITLIIIAPIYRSYHTNNEIIALYGYLSCFDAIALGCISAIIAQRVKLTSLMKKALFYTSIASMISVYLYANIMSNVVAGVSIMACSAAIYLITVNDNREKNTQSSSALTRLVCWLGKNSYELYLFHIIILALMKALVTPSTLNSFTEVIWMGLFISISCFVVNIISKYYSIPANRELRKLLFSVKQKSISTSPTPSPTQTAPPY